jgi:hypothetical protein
MDRIRTNNVFTVSVIIFRIRIRIQIVRLRIWIRIRIVRLRIWIRIRIVLLRIQIGYSTDIQIRIKNRTDINTNIDIFRILNKNIVCIIVCDPFSRAPHRLPVVLAMGCGRRTRRSLLSVNLFNAG